MHIKKQTSQTDSGMEIMENDLIDNDANEETATNKNDAIKFDQKSVVPSKTNKTLCTSLGPVDSNVSIENDPSNICSDLTDELVENCENQLFKQLSEQFPKLTEATLLNNQKVDYMEFQTPSGDMKKLKLVKINPDGNCLFASLGHQIFGSEIKVNSRQHKNLTKDLRMKVSKHVQTNFEKYKGWARGSIDESADNWEAESKFFVNVVLPKNGKFAGAESIKALSDIYGVNVVIFAENDTCYFHHTFDPNFARCVAISYRKYGDTAAKGNCNHYDSIIDINSNDLLVCVQKLVGTHVLFLEKKDTTTINLCEDS